MALLLNLGMLAKYPDENIITKRSSNIGNCDRALFMCIISNHIYYVTVSKFIIFLTE